MCEPCPVHELSFVITRISPKKPEKFMGLQLGRETLGRTSCRVAEVKKRVLSRGRMTVENMARCVT